jgi:hypothetical protein
MELLTNVGFLGDMCISIWILLQKVPYNGKLDPSDPFWLFFVSKARSRERFEVLFGGPECKICMNSPPTSSIRFDNCIDSHPISSVRLEQH